MEACFAVKDGQATLLSILNKTIKAMPSDMLTSAIAMYDSTAYKTTFYSFLKDHLVVVLVLGFSDYYCNSSTFTKGKTSRGEC